MASRATAKRVAEWNELQEMQAAGKLGGILESSVIPTPQGPKVAGNLQAGDFVFAADGTPSEVVGVRHWNPSDEPLYEVTLKDNRTVRCSGNALWEAYRWTHCQNKKILAPLILSTDQILHRGVALHRTADNGETHAWNKFHIPMCAPLQYPEQDLPVDPYVVGAFLGDGNIGEYARMLGLSCSPEDEETVSRIAEIIGAADYVRNSENNYNWYFILPPDKQQTTGRIYFHVTDVFGNLREVIHNAGDKYIPEMYKYS